jgi:hypothetical protein
VLTYESSVAVTFFGLHLLINEPECVLDENQVSNICTWTEHTTYDMAGEVAKTMLAF